MTKLTWDTSTEWDNGQQETNVRHENPTGQTWAGASTLELGYPSYVGNLSGTLRSYYPCSESSGATTVYDVHGANDGEYRGPNVAATTGVFNDNVPTYDGTDDLTDTNNTFQSANTSVSGDDAMAVAAWVRKTSWNGSYEQVFSNYDGSTGGIGLLRDGSNNRLRVAMGAEFVRGATDIADGAWHFVVGQMDSENAGEVWVDAALDRNSSIATADSEATTQDHYIGAQPDGTGTDPAGSGFWAGEIQHLMVFDCYDGGNASLLSSSDISQLYEITSNPQYVSSKKLS